MEMQYQEQEQYGTGNIKLTIYIMPVYAYITGIWIFDDKLHLVAYPKKQEPWPYNREYMLAAGRYTIRVDVNGQLADNIVDIFKDTVCNAGSDGGAGAIRLKIPEQFSSALLGNHSGNELGYQSSHEYYTEPAVEISKIETSQRFAGSNTGSGLFIFLRYPDAHKYESVYKGREYWQQFSVLNEYFETIRRFPEDCITDDNTFGWNLWPRSGYIGFNTRLEKGMYFLKYDGEDDPRIIPVYVYENWYTQFFMTVAAKPLFGTVRVFLQKEMVFDPIDKNNYYIDVCMRKLQNSDFTLDTELLKNVAYEKFDSPMLGLLGAYIYLSGKVIKDDDLFQIIVKNLQMRILKNSSDSPDIWALNLLSFRHFGKTVVTDEKPVLSGTPMLRIAFDVIRNNAVTYPWLVLENSLNDHIAENQVFDSPFNTFRPFKNVEDIGKARFELKYNYSSVWHTRDIDLLKGRSLDLALFEDEKQYQAFNELKIEVEPYSEKKLSEFKEKLSVPSSIGRLGCAIINAIIKDHKTNPVKIARDLGMPIYTISRKMTELDLFR